jgi:hypothetical protein
VIGVIFLVKNKKSAPAENAPATTTTQSGANPSDTALIRQLSNARIPNFALDENDFVQLKDGRIEEEWENSGSYWSIHLNDEPQAYTVADFDRNGGNDVAVVIGASGGGSGYFYYLAIFANENDTLTYLTSVQLGDRIKVNKISYSTEVIYADIITQGPGEPMCCGTMPQTLKFKLEKNKLVRVL